jgi:DNA (cytosine-5)-methyltransferase 1
MKTHPSANTKRLAMDGLRVFDMFCGAGGSSIGAERVGAKVVGGVDAWPLAAQTYSLNHPDAVVFCDRVESISSRRLRAEIGNIDLLIASPECTSHSVAKGSKPGCEMSRETAFEVVRYARLLEPRWVVVENVLQMQQWKRYEEWKQELQRLGYKIASAVIDAQYHRTPQSRRRLILVADREATPELPEPGVKTRKTVGSVIGRGEPTKSPWRFSPLHTKAAATRERAQRAIASLGRKQDFLLVYYGSDGAGGYQTLDRPLRTITTVDRFALVRPTKSGHEMRMLQPTELAAAMGFPSDYQWPLASRRERIKLLGNAVCPEVMRDVVAHLTKIGA